MGRLAEEQLADISLHDPERSQNESYAEQSTLDQPEITVSTHKTAESSANDALSKSEESVVQEGQGSENTGRAPLLDNNLEDQEQEEPMKDGTVASQASRKDKLLAKPKQWKQTFKDNKLVKKYLHDPQPIFENHQAFGMVSSHRRRSRTTAGD